MRYVSHFMHNNQHITLFVFASHYMHENSAILINGSLSLHTFCPLSFTITITSEIQGILKRTFEKEIDLILIFKLNKLRGSPNKITSVMPTYDTLRKEHGYSDPNTHSMLYSILVSGFSQFQSDLIR
jgi:hypothetical protein